MLCGRISCTQVDFDISEDVPTLAPSSSNADEDVDAEGSDDDLEEVVPGWSTNMPSREEFSSEEDDIEDRIRIQSMFCSIHRCVQGLT